MSERIWLSSPHMSDEGYEEEFVRRAFEENWIAPLGTNVNEFENEIKKFVGAEHAVAMSSGTAAIHLALKACGVGEGDVVFCQSLTFAASANPIVYLGAKPVFIDSDFETWNLDPVLLEKAFQKYPRAKAVIAVNLYGLCADMDSIAEICRRHGATLIEDAAESLGSTYKDKQSGTLGDYGIFSFNGNKIITTSGGGMLVSDNKERLEKVKFWATQSKEDELHYEHKELGFNYRMSNVCAGIGRGQLKVLPDRVRRKREIFYHYKNALSDLPGIEFMPENDWNRPNFWLSCLLLPPGENPVDLIKILAENNIESRPVWKPMHLQPFYADSDSVGGGVSEEIFARGICLPSDTKISDSDLERVCRIIRQNR